MFVDTVRFRDANNDAEFFSVKHGNSDELCDIGGVSVGHSLRDALHVAVADAFFYKHAVRHRFAYIHPVLDALSLEHDYANVHAVKLCDCHEYAVDDCDANGHRHANAVELGNLYADADAVPVIHRVVLSNKFADTDDDVFVGRVRLKHIVCYENDDALADAHGNDDEIDDIVKLADALCGCVFFYVANGESGRATLHDINLFEHAGHARLSRHDVQHASDGDVDLRPLAGDRTVRREQKLFFRRRAARGVLCKRPLLEYCDGSQLRLGDRVQHTVRAL